MLFITQMTEFELNEFFSQYGKVKDAKVITDRQGVSKGWVKFIIYAACIGIGNYKHIHYLHMDCLFGEHYYLSIW